MKIRQKFRKVVPAWAMVVGGEYQYQTKYGVYEVIKSFSPKYGERSWFAYGPGIVGAEVFETMTKAQKYVEEFSSQTQS